MILWDEVIFAESVLEDGKEDDLNYWAGLLIRYHIYKSSTDKTICGFKKYFDENENKDKNEITKLLLTYLKCDDEKKKNKRAAKMISKINDALVNDEKNDRVFINHKPIKIYKSEVEKINEIGEMHNYISNGHRKPCDILQRYLLVWLVWQKAYQNGFKEHKQWATVKDDQLFPLAEKSGESGQRCVNFRKLIDGDYIKYQMQPCLEPRERFPISLFQICFIKHSGKKEEVAFTITDFNHIFLHYKRYLGANIKECAKCKELFEYERDSKKHCNVCAKKVKNEQTNESKKKNK